MSKLTPELKAAFDAIMSQFRLWDNLNDCQYNALFATYQMGVEADKWIPIGEYPKENPTVMRWHKTYNCPISVIYRRPYSKDGCNWITGTLDNT